MGNNNGKNYTCSKLKKPAKKLILLPFKEVGQNNNHEEKLSSAASEALDSMSEICEEGNYTATVSCKNVCSICLEALVIKRKAIFTSSECGHSFHMSCISSNISHGSLTCPVCRAQWTSSSSSPSPSLSPSRYINNNSGIDMVLVATASPNGGCQLKQSIISQVVHALRCVDRLAIVNEYHHPRSRPSRCSCSGSIIIINDLEMLSSSHISVHHIHVDSTASLMLHLPEFVGRRDQRIIKFN